MVWSAAGDFMVWPAAGDIILSKRGFDTLYG